MTSDYDYTLSGTAVRALLGASAKSRRRAEHLLDAIAADPSREPDFTEVAPSGRRFSVFVQSDLVVALWVDHAEKEVRIVNVEFV